MRITYNFTKIMPKSRKNPQILYIRFHFLKIQTSLSEKNEENYLPAQWDIFEESE